MIVLDLLGYLGPQILPALEEGEGERDGQVGDGHGFAVAERCVLEVRVQQDGKVLVHQLLETLLRRLLAHVDSEDDVSDGCDGLIHGGLSPIHDHVDLRAKDGIGGVILLPPLIGQAEVTHDGAALPYRPVGSVELEGRAGVTGVHRDEFRRASLSVGILDLDVEFERLYDGGAALAVRGCARRACG